MDLSTSSHFHLPYSSYRVVWITFLKRRVDASTITLQKSFIVSLFVVSSPHSSSLSSHCGSWRTLSLSHGQHSWTRHMPSGSQALTSAAASTSKMFLYFPEDKIPVIFPRLAPPALSNPSFLQAPAALCYIPGITNHTLTSVTVGCIPIFFLRRPWVFAGQGTISSQCLCFFSCKIRIFVPTS